MGRQGAQEQSCWVMTNQRYLKQDSQSWASADAPRPATATAEEVLGATSPPTADCENCTERVAKLQEVPGNQITYINPVAWASQCTAQGGRTTLVFVAQVLGPVACHLAQGEASASVNMLQRTDSHEIWWMTPLSLGKNHHSLFRYSQFTQSEGAAVRPFCENSLKEFLKSVLNTMLLYSV